MQLDICTIKYIVEHQSHITLRVTWEKISSQKFVVEQAFHRKLKVISKFSMNFSFHRNRRVKRPLVKEEFFHHIQPTTQPRMSRWKVSCFTHIFSLYGRRKMNFNLLLWRVESWLPCKDDQENGNFLNLTDRWRQEKVSCWCSIMVNWGNARLG